MSNVTFTQEEIDLLQDAEAEGFILPQNLRGFVADVARFYRLDEIISIHEEVQNYLDFLEGEQAQAASHNEMQMFDGPIADAGDLAGRLEELIDTLRQQLAAANPGAVAAGQIGGKKKRTKARKTRKARKGRKGRKVRKTRRS